MADERGGAGRRAARGLVTPGRLHALLLAATLLGIVLPLLPWLELQAAEGFPTWRNFARTRPAIERFVAEHPALDPARLAPAVRALPWEPPRHRASLRYYRSYAAANAVILAALLAARRPVRRGLTRACDWVHAPGHPRARRIVLAWCAGIVLAYLTKTPLGFWIPAGIGGWTYAGLEPQLRAAPPPDLQPPPPHLREALERAVVPEHARFLPDTGDPGEPGEPGGPRWLEGPAMLLHFAGGEVLPASWDLTDLAKPAYVFGTEGGRVERPEVFAAVVRNALAWRRRGARFLVPGRLGYPNHRAYPWIDYRSSPPPEDLERITSWRVTLRIGADRSVELVGAVRTGEVDAG